ncbi:sulfotransferase domain-containing protein [Labrys sp. LIt4]|uniref:sulfotransferase domain-containing protein n=1 Tax=Labrys sp. LIt4 TaxID=2821355 RepID=UPI001ADFCBC3
MACMPKSASTFITSAIANAVKLNSVNLIPSYGRREQELCEIRLAQNAGLDYIAQHHIKHSTWTEELCSDYDVSIIVLIRSLFDVVVSIRDHVHRESPVNPFFYLDKQHLNRDEAELEHMIAMLAIPWYINFYMGWRSSKAARIFMYEDFVVDQNKAISEMLAFAGIPANAAQIAAGLEAARSQGSRINVGKAGRGMNLKPETVRMIMDMLAAYPEIQDDRYVQMMKAQAARILAAGTEEVVAAPPPLSTSKPLARPSLAMRTRRYFRRKARLLGKRRNPLIAMGLLAFAGLYYAFLYNLIPNSLSGGRTDDLIVPAILVFAAARLLTSTKIKPVPVPFKKVDAATSASAH